MQVVLEIDVDWTGIEFEGQLFLFNLVTEAFGEVQE